MSRPFSLFPNNQPFFRPYWVGDINGVQHKMMIWATNQSLSLLRYKGHTFFDGTFRTTPNPFDQCLIIMVFENSSDLYIPCDFSLGTGKNEYIYCEFLYQVIMLLEHN
ncbi:hypothetical protein HZS_274 [Henneguya salminicola]|nr:hypothetical protein HZS_274 [Henneguya salminicola]